MVKNNMYKEARMTQELRERMAVVEKQLEGLINQMRVEIEKIDQIEKDVSILSNRNGVLETRFDTFIRHIDLKIETILTSHELFKSQFNEKQIIDRTQLAYEEKQKRRLIKFLGIVGTLFLACISNIDKLDRFFNPPPLVVESASSKN